MYFVLFHCVVGCCAHVKSAPLNSMLTDWSGTLNIFNKYKKNSNINIVGMAVVSVAGYLIEGTDGL